MHELIVSGKYEVVDTDVRESLKEALGICDAALVSVRRQRMFYLLVSCLLVIPLMWSMELEYTTMSIGVTIGLNLGRILLTSVLCYTLFMSTIWNSVESNALKAGYLAMEIHLVQLNNILNTK